MKSRKLNHLILPALLAMAGISSAALVTFETGQGYSVGSIGALNGGTTNAPFTGQQGWSLSTSNAPGSIITTTSSNEYIGGQAISVGAASSTYIGGKLGIVETAVSSTITFDVRFESGVNVLVGYLGDNGNNLFDQNLDTGMQFGGGGGQNPRYRDALFVNNQPLAPSGSLTTGEWYRYSVAIGQSISGNRSITMSVRNLTTAANLDINGAPAGNDWTFSVTDAQFGVAPENAVGGFVRISGTNTGTVAAIDNLRFTAIPEPSAALLGGLGMLCLLLRRRA